ncbi:MAG: hypothetical protein KDI66_11685 [Xanthomonadales bacterium]|nr:hypothetical protein [Xanthomonadales bacterium]
MSDPAFASVGLVNQWSTGRKAYVLLALLALLVCLLSVALHGLPVPYIHDEFTYLFAGETYSQLRLSNPSPPSPESFWSPHMLVEPTFSSKYPPAQGLFLALGFWLGHPFIGLMLSGMVAAVALLWALRAMVRPLPALAVSAAFVFTVLSTGTWIRSYMGGLVAFACAALVLGFFLRLRWGRPSRPAFVALGIGVAGLFLSRPFEGAIVCVLCSFAYADQIIASVRGGLRPFAQSAVIAVIPLLLALMFQGALNQSVTGSVWRMPHSVYHAQYMNQPIFIWQDAKAASKPSPRLITVEESQIAPGGWASHAELSLRASYHAIIFVGGVALLWLVLIGLPLLAYAQWRLILVIAGFPLLQAASNYVELHYYFAPVAPIWFLALGALFQVVLDWPRKPAMSLALIALVLAGLYISRLLATSDVQTIRHYHDLVQALSDKPSSLVFVTYAPGTSGHLNVVYNDPELRNHALFVNELDRASNCTVLDAFGGGRQIWRIQVSNGGMSGGIVSPQELCPIPAQAVEPAR